MKNGLTEMLPFFRLHASQHLWLYLTQSDPYTKYFLHYQSSYQQAEQSVIPSQLTMNGFVRARQSSRSYDKRSNTQPLLPTPTDFLYQFLFNVFFFFFSAKA